MEWLVQRSRAMQRAGPGTAYMVESGRLFFGRSRVMARLLTSGGDGVAHQQRPQPSGAAALMV